MDVGTLGRDEGSLSEFLCTDRLRGRSLIQVGKNCNIRISGRSAHRSCIGVVEACGSRTITNLEGLWRYKALNLIVLYDRSSLGYDFV